MACSGRTGRQTEGRRVAQRAGVKTPRILLTFTGFHDPFASGAVVGVEQEGPVLSLIRAYSFDRIVLFATPGTSEITRVTESAVRERHPALAVESCCLPLEDPTDYEAILRGLRRHFS